MAVWTEWLGMSFFGNSVAEYVRALLNCGAIFLALILLKRLIIGRLSRFAQKTSSDLDDFLVDLLSHVGPPVFLVTALYFAVMPLKLDAAVRAPIRYALIIVVTFRIILLLQKVVRYIVSKSYRKNRPDDPAVDSVTRNTTHLVGWVIWALGSVFVLDNLGVNISALVAGLGIGGVAVAMASQAVLGDLFSALSIFIDKPFEVGDFIIVDDKMGTVEYVGLKTTRIRSLSGEQLVFSNSDLTKSRVQNFKRMETRRIVFKIGVVYQTPLEKVRQIPGLIRDIFARIDGVRLDRAHFQSFGDFSLVYEVVYFVQSADYNVYMDKQQLINFALKESFEREGIEFAYPTQTLFISRPA